MRTNFVLPNNLKSENTTACRSDSKFIISYLRLLLIDFSYKCGNEKNTVLRLLFVTNLPLIEYLIYLQKLKKDLSFVHNHEIKHAFHKIRLFYFEHPFSTSEVYMQQTNVCFTSIYQGIEKELIVFHYTCTCRRTK